MLSFLAIIYLSTVGLNEYGVDVALGRFWAVFVNLKGLR